VTRIYGSPSRYVQGAGALDDMASFLAPLGQRALLVADQPVLDLIGRRVAAVCATQGIECQSLVFSGEITPEEIERLGGLARAMSAQFVMAAGGGKGIDAGKGVAHRLGVPVVTLPTAASNDAPTSKLFVLYDHNHRVLRVEHMTSNPALVVVDTQVIAAAPARLFTAGIGDAIVKKFEVAQAIGAGGPNLFGGQATLTAQALADLCYTTIRAKGEAALQAVTRKQADAALEDVVEAAVLHSGLGFESGGLSVCHAMTRGLSAVRGSRDALHGHQVAYALLVQLTPEGRAREFIDDVSAFYRGLGLPTRLADLGLADASADELRAIAEGTMTAAYIKNFQRTLTAADVAAAASVEAR